jgi:hypothetical protein
MEQIFWIYLLLISTVGYQQKAVSPLSTEKEQQEVLLRMQQLADAGLKRKADLLEKIYSKNYFHTNADGSIIDRSAVLASYRLPAEALVRSTTGDEFRIEMFKDTAVVSNRVTLHGTRKNGAQFITRFRTTTVLVKSEDNWQVVNSHASFLDER